MIGPFKPAPGKFTCVFVLIDKFSKWIEYMPLVKASSEKDVVFLDQVIHHFGIPNSIITDLGTQFTGNAFWDFYDERSIVVKYVSVAHPRANGQVERANGMILDALKKRMYRENEKSSRKMAQRVTSRGLGPQNLAQLQYRRITILYGLRC